VLHFDSLLFYINITIRLFAHVNTSAEKSDDLYFEKFELAPEPDEDDGLA
jgi:hypothetical protein